MRPSSLQLHDKVQLRSQPTPRMVISYLIILASQAAVGPPFTMLFLVLWIPKLMRTGIAWRSCARTVVGLPHQAIFLLLCFIWLFVVFFEPFHCHSVCLFAFAYLYPDTSAESLIFSFRSGGHLGHVFKGEGFDTPTDTRHCVNSVSIRLDQALDADAIERQLKEAQGGAPNL